MAKSSTLKKQRLHTYNRIITANKNKLKAGSKLTRADFVTLFGLTGIVNKGNYAKVHKANLRLVQAQNEINSLMEENGLYLSSRNYYGEFYVRDRKRTAAVVERHSREVDVFTAATTRLEATLVQRVSAGTWGRYNKVAAKTVDAIADGHNRPESARHSNVRARMAQYV